MSYSISPSLPIHSLSLPILSVHPGYPPLPSPFALSLPPRQSRAPAPVAGLTAGRPARGAAPGWWREGGSARTRAQLAVEEPRVTGGEGPRGGGCGGALKAAALGGTEDLAEVVAASRRRRRSLGCGAVLCTSLCLIRRRLSSSARQRGRRGSAETRFGSGGGLRRRAPLLSGEQGPLSPFRAPR